MFLAHVFWNERHGAFFKQCGWFHDKLNAAILGNGLQQNGLVDQAHLNQDFAQEQTLATFDLRREGLAKLIGAERSVLN